MRYRYCKHGFALKWTLFVALIHIVHPKIKFCHHLKVVFLLNVKEDILKNAGNQTVDVTIDSIVFL